MKECPKCAVCFEDDVDLCPNDASELRMPMPGSLVIDERYHIISRLGRGAMGQVYLARDTKFDSRMVAVKTVRPDFLSSDAMADGEAIVRFRREAQAAASIQHPNTVSVTDFGQTKESVFYLVMEFVDGETLHSLLRREGTLPVKRAVRLLRQIADGIQAAHDLGILHRDLKPGNVFILQVGKSGEGFVKVGDFGLAKFTSGSSSDSASHASPSSRGILGTPEYMSPEQMRAGATVDVRSDLYSLASIAYLMLAGATPFSGDLMQLITQKLMERPKSLLEVRTDIPASVDRVVLGALETDADLRPASVTEWIDALEEAAEQVGESKAGGSRLVVIAPPGAEVYVDDERRASVGSTGRVVIAELPAGQHVLRVSRGGDRDDERVIEIRGDEGEQLVQARLVPDYSSSSPQYMGAADVSSLMPGVVACRKCGARFAEGVRFCGRCGGDSFTIVSRGDASLSGRCPRCSSPMPSDSRFCGRCGLGLSAQGLPLGQPQFVSNSMPSAASQAQRICPSCDTAFPAHIRFCGRCGISLGA
jgi:tRNA A-37 threonylcarbamoyl transferase component Bud32/RNA polymerase subunit RPABC4/transcription elongation factor Spt4